MPALSILQPANVATPATAVSGFAVHDSVAPPDVVSASVTAVTLLVTVLPTESSIATTGCVVNGTPPVPVVPGCVVNASFVALPGVIVTSSLMSDASRPSLAVSV